MSKPPFTNIHVGLKTGGRPCFHEKKIIVGTSVTVTKDNLMEVVSEGFINILKEKGCKIVLYIEYVPADGVDVENAFDDPERLLMEQKLNELRNTYKDIIFISFPGDEKGFLTSEHTGGCVLFGKITDVEKIISADDKINRP